MDGIVWNPVYNNKGVLYSITALLDTTGERAAEPQLLLPANPSNAMLQGHKATCRSLTLSCICIPS